MSNGIPAHELRSLGNDDPVVKLEGLREGLFNLRFQSATGQLANNRRLRIVHKDTARICIAMRERELSLSAVPTDGNAARVRKT